MRYLIFLLLLIVSEAFTQNVEIHGSSSLPGKQLRILIRKDYISGQDSILAETLTDFKGSFMLRFQLSGPEIAQISIGLHKTGLLLNPGSTYEIALSLNGEAATSYYDPQPLQLEIKSSNDNGMQKQFETLNFIYNAFIVTKFNTAMRSGRADYLDSLEVACRKSIPDLNHPFLVSYNTYKLSSLYPPVKRMNQQQIFASFFTGKAVQYRNPEYVGMLEQYFGDYFLTSSKATDLDGFIHASAEGMKPLLQYLEKDELMKSDAQLREFVLLMHLNFNYHNPAFFAGSVDGVLKQVSKESLFREHKEIASNILDSRRHLMPNTAAPPLTLFDKDGKKITLSDNSLLKLLVFVRKDCEVCNKTLNELADLVSKRGNEMEIIVISPLDGLASFAAYAKKNAWGWQVYHTGEEVTIYEQYNIRVFPEIIILLPGHKIGMAPAPPMGENLEFHLDRLIKQIEQ